MRRKIASVSFALAALTSSAIGAHVYQGTPDLDVPFVPTPYEVVDAMLSMAQVTSRDTVYDLGCGDGRVVIAAAQRHGARAVGFDLDPARVNEARSNAGEHGLGNRVDFRQVDLFTVDLSPATVLTLYLLPDVNLRLRERILGSMRPGARVVSHDFDMGDWEPDSTATIGQHVIYGWIVPARVEGTWRWTSPLPDSEQRYAVKLEQERQKVTGTMLNAEGKRASGTSPSLDEAALSGARLTFTVTDRHRGRPITMRYAGKVNGTRADGTVTVEDGESWQRIPWTATRSSGAQTSR